MVVTWSSVEMTPVHEELQPSSQEQGVSQDWSQLESQLVRKAPSHSLQKSSHPTVSSQLLVQLPSHVVVVVVVVVVVTSFPGSLVSTVTVTLTTGSKTVPPESLSRKGHTSLSQGPPPPSVSHSPL